MKAAKIILSVLSLFAYMSVLFYMWDNFEQFKLILRIYSVVGHVAVVALIYCHFTGKKVA